MPHLRTAAARWCVRWWSGMHSRSEWGTRKATEQRAGARAGNPPRPRPGRAVLLRPPAAEQVARALLRCRRLRELSAESESFTAGRADLRAGRRFASVALASSHVV